MSVGIVAHQRFPEIYREPSGLVENPSAMLAGVAQPKGTPGTGSQPSKPIPELPAWKAFVVQFTREAGTHAGIFSGRVEHLSSGRRARFNSADELLKTLEKMLDELGAASHADSSED